MQKNVLIFPTAESRTTKHANAAQFCEEKSIRQTAVLSEPSARRKLQSEAAWSPLRVPAQLITLTEEEQRNSQYRYK